MSARSLIVMVHMVSISLILKTFIHGVSGHHRLHEYLCLVMRADAVFRMLNMKILTDGNGHERRM